MKKNLIRLITYVLIMTLCLSLSISAYASDIIIIGGGDSGGGNGGNGGGGVDVGNGEEPGRTVQAAVITKDPTGETLDAGDDAVFIARAEHYDDILWIISSPDGKNYEGNSAANVFAGLVVNGYDEEELVLEKVPYDMNGYTVQCRFTGEDGENVYTDKATITVNKVEISTALINAEPQATVKNLGESLTLSVTATSPDSGSLKYQWYRNTENKTEGGTAISGAINAAYTPEQSEGTYYYYVGVWNVVGNQTSQAVYTKPAAVTYVNPLSAPQEAPAGVQPGTAEPAADGTPVEPTTPPAARPGVDNAENNEGNTMLMIISVVLCVAVLAAVAALIIIRRKEKELDEEYDDDEDDEFYKP